MQTHGLSYREFQSHPLLRPFVKCLWTIKCDAHIPNPDHGVIPGGHTDLVFNLGGEIIHEQSRDVFVDAQKSVLVGPFDTFRRYRALGQFEFLGVRFHSGKVPFSSSFPVLDARNQAVPLESVLAKAQASNEIENPNDDLARMTGTRERLNYVERFLVRSLPLWKEADPTVTAALNRIEQTHGQVPVEVLASELGVTQRGLERKFAQHVGLSPKAFCRIRRFQLVKTMLEQKSESPDAQMAFSSGYYDQTHLIREFRLFTGQTPSAYKELRSVGFFLYGR